MTNENRIKTEALNEVIEECRKVKKNYPKGSGAYSIVVKLQDFVQSLIPKEEPERQIKEPIIRCNNCNQEVKPEPTKDIKAGEKVEVRDGECDKWQDGWVFTGGYNLDGLYICEREHFLEPFNYIRKPLQKTQEEMDREIAENAWEVLCRKDGFDFSIGLTILKGQFMDEYLEAINYGRKTKQD